MMIGERPERTSHLLFLLSGQHVPDVILADVAHRTGELANLEQRLVLIP